MSKRHIDGKPTWAAQRKLRSVGSPPVSTAMRTAKLASIPIAFAGRHAAGVGKRVIGRPADQVNRDIQVRTAQHMFEVLGELKTGAAKLGQILSIYELALPPEIAEPYRTALSRLQHSAPAMLPSAVHDVLADSMGANWRDNFLAFDDRRPLAASVGQVHRAQWHDGRTVAVKVQYPGARQAMKSDLAQLKRLTAIGSIFVPGADLKALAAELSDIIAEELEYSIEAANQRTFAAAFAGDPDLFVPDVVAQRGDVLVSEWVEGTPLSNLIAWGKQADRDRIGLLLARFNLSAHLRCGLMYGDPHPGNFLVMPDGRLGVVDFGACSIVPESVIAIGADIWLMRL